MSASAESTPNVARPQIRVFFCYAHEDDDLRRELLRHLSILRHSEVISAWYDGEIMAGKEWEKEISSHLAASHIVILLVSPSFLASDYCYNIEMKHALERHDAGEARVIPVILRPVDWEGAPFAKLQMLPRDAKPVTKWAERDEAFVSVAQGIRNAVVELLALHQLSNDKSSAKTHNRSIEQFRHSSKATPNAGFANTLQQKRLEYLEEAYEELQSAYATLQMETASERDEHATLLAEIEKLRDALANKDENKLIAQLKSENSDLRDKLVRKQLDYDRLLSDAQAKVWTLMERVKELNNQLLDNSAVKGKHKS